jgi:CheY-like chemotaxis protein
MAAHAATNDIPIVVVTGDTRPIDTSAFACVLRKPVTAHALIEAVRNCLREHRIAAPDGGD